MNLISLTVLILLSILAPASANFCGEWNTINLTTDVPLARPNDTIFVHYLAAPLMYCTTGNLLATMNGYHGGIGMSNKNSGYSITFNYDAYPNFFEAVFPGITTYPNGTTVLSWSYRGIVEAYHGVNLTYWNSLNVHIATMTGAQFNAFVKWLADFGNQTFTEYNTLAVYKSFPDRPWLDGYECFDFAFDCIRKIQILGGTLVPSVKTLKQSIANVYSNKMPQEVSFDDPKYHDDIIRYFQMLKLSFKKLGLVNFIKQLMKFLLEGNCYVHYGRKYYHVEVAYPFFKQHWHDFPVPIVNASNAMAVNKYLQNKWGTKY